jgi:transmembrane sensor
MQNRDKYLEIEDFIGDQSFQLWVRLNEDTQGWEEWTLENSNRAKLVEEARLWILSIKAPNAELPLDKIEKALELTWKKI